jgi:Zn-dependent peptidase ImmA (M78 family)
LISLAMLPDRPIQSHLAEHLAKSMLSGIDAFPPINLDVLAERLGVREIRDSPLKEDGRTTWQTGRPVIELREDRPATRRRFTLAHELAHVLIARDRTRSVYRASQMSDESEEALCDWVAAAVLMPYEWIKPYASREMLNLSLLRLVAHRAEVSLSAAAVRIAEVGRRTCMFLQWRRVGDHWGLTTRAAVPKQLSGYLELDDATAQTLNELTACRDSWHQVFLTSDGFAFSGRAQLDRTATNCLMLITQLDAGEPRPRVR